ncbi:hypothetical protein CcCBS67573_g08182 [Chytriomyces confervae]|uniref:Glycosyltransferase 2-like domain-containing protein n=1 Tax=Chytriomyces confervae TaxID=246404 RepID=A0A507EPG9_9FUNG|nr:hypothetical protein CcCBS67573_g08182 [Chytriomyces confervae]
MTAEYTWSACSSNLLETWNVQQANQTATHFFCSQQPHAEKDIHNIRNTLIQQSGALESTSTDDFILFLDHCETLTDTFSLSQMMNAYFLASKSSTQSFNHEPKFIFTNTLHFLSDKLVEVAFTEDEYNPYDISVGTTATGHSRQHDMDRSPVPPTSSMLTLVNTWHRAFEFYAQTGSEIYSAGITRTNHKSNSNCASANEAFWVSFSLNGITGYHLPLPLLKSQQHPSDPTLQTCRIDVRKLKRNLPNSLSAVSLLKCRWRPSVSVIVPFYNVPHSIWFLQTLKSLSMQSFSDFEIIIVDDGSDEHLPSSALLRQFGESIQASKGLWDGQLPAMNNSECKEPPSLLFGSTQPPHFFEDLPPSDISQPSLRPAQIPVRIIRHKINSGLAESRNTGVRTARSHHVFFLDPDDLLTATSLEKFALTAAFSFGPLKRSPNTRVSFLHMPVTHFPDPIAPICSTSNHPQEGEAPKSHGIDSNKLYIHNANPPPPLDLLTVLRHRNPLTSTAVVSKWDYIAVGGTCPRTTLRFFEDYDFWLRMAGAYGRVGVVSGEPGLFWYRRHEKGMSSKIMRDTLTSRVGFIARIKSWLFQKEDVAQIVDDTWLGEGRLNNPVAFGDLGRGEVERMLRLRNVRRTKTRHEEVEDDGVGSLEQFMPCYRTFETSDESLNPHIHQFWRMRRDFLNTEFGDFISSYKYHQLFDISIRNGSLLDPITPLLPLFPAHVFPFNPSTFHHISNPLIPSNKSILYILPWMVTGGADLYDIHVLSALKATFPSSSTTLVVARNLPHHPHPWSHKFMPLVEQVFHLQLLSNDSTVQNLILDYLAESRNVDIFINSRTVAGYDAIERWGTTTQNTSPNNFSFTPPRMMDILHLHHPLPDNSNWEHRSARVSKFLTNRVVVSRNLKTHLVEVLGLGDAILGKPAHPSDPQNTRCNTTGVINSSRCTPLTGPDETKISIIYPPLDLTTSTISNQVTDALQKLVNLETSNMETSSKVQDTLSNLFLRHQTTTQSALYFLGRLTAQKDPLMWINVASKARSLYTDLSRTPPNIHFIGSGDLLQDIHRRLQLDKHLEPPNLPNLQTQQHPILIKQLSSTTHFHLEVSHEQVLHLLLTSSSNAVTLLTSQFEGVPIAVLESLALGIPVVTMWCGGTSEVFEAATGAETAIPFGTTINLGKEMQTVEVESLDCSKFMVTRMPLGSLIHVKCDELIREGYKRDADNDAHVQHKYTQAQVEAVMASEVLRFWREMEEDKAQSALEKRAMRWVQGKRVRRKFGVKSFESEWARILSQNGELE